MTTNPNIKKNLEKLVKRTVDEAAELERVEREAIANYRGQMGDLESALGMLRLGHHLGWKVLVVVHNKRTVRKYEQILGIKVREFFLEEGPSAERSMAYVVARKLGNFWKAVSGDVKLAQRREIGK